MHENRKEPTSEEIKRVLQEAALRDFPNPERRGCPGVEAVSSAAAKTLPHEDAHWRHISRCSPCYREYLEARATVLARRRTRRRVQWVAAAAVIAIVTTWVLLSLRGHPPSLSPAQPSEKRTLAESHGTRTLTAVLNMPAPVADGTRSGTMSGTDLQHLPRARVDPLLIYLPLGNDPGKYTVEIRPSPSDRPTATLTGNADIRDGLTVLRVAVDLSIMSAGTYTMSVWREGNAVLKCRFSIS